MTLTLEDVKNVRFRIAKRQGEGYMATEVDEFVDRVDETFGTMLEENERLKAQLDALDGSAGEAGQADNSELEAENQRLRAELEQARTAAPVAPVADDSQDSAELELLRRENAELRGQLDGARSELEQARATTGLTVMDGNQSGTGRVEKIVVTTAAQASPAVTRLVQLATEQAEAVVSEAENEAARKVEEANRQAHEVTIDAQTRAERIQSEARVNADQMTQGARAEAERVESEARARSEALTTDVDNRRRELFTALESERDELVGKVDHLRSFETSYRSNLVNHFRSQLDAVENSRMEPSEAPALLTEERPQAPVGQSAAAPQAAGQSATPRLDALLAEGN
ncbi:DivIVA domain-containing protein [Luteococcus peritonei]|uniref:Cell wall synthesis protein Wag31 n=1 Tax=Luteococcus peritonei TaxID=88874 RepID=A0ABW4RSM5_9ACTN